ncbi:MAG: helix-turn-helix domain-containing protein, partial [Treponema sp.]|nr:helix-turn-helix domain-containing protein [Treponema sp.]
MMDEKAYNKEQFSILTRREHEILNLLLDGILPKEIAFSLNIKLPTVIYHQYNIYKKLDIHSINELLVKFLRVPFINTTFEITPVFSSLGPITDDNGSSISISKKLKKIKDQYCLCYSIKGKLADEGICHAGVCCFPDSATLETIKKMTSFSFNIIGDGNIYEISVNTSDTRKKGGYNHYCKQFT